MNDLDFTGNTMKSYYLDAHLDGQDFSILNAVASADESVERIGFFRRIKDGSLKNIKIDSVTFENINAYQSSKTVGLLAGDINNSTFDNITIKNSLLVMHTDVSSLSQMGLFAGIFTNVTINKITLENNQVEFHSSTSSTTYYGVALFLGTNGTSNNTTVISNITFKSNEIYHSFGNNTTNSPAIVIANPGFRVANTTSLTISNLTHTSSTFYVLDTSINNRFRYGYYAYFNSNFNLEAVFESSISGTESVQIANLAGYTRN